ncbi:MAG: hypothetical protein JNG88_02200 [Phycisphaerales bacterium]|nr:hypothetical protein [Phycisphaerales bacterium]
MFAVRFAMSSHRSTAAQTAAAFQPVTGVEQSVACRREARILLSLCAIWLIGVCDLAFTISESEHQHFDELNPVAAMLVDSPPALLATYKLGLSVFGTSVLVILRRYPASETACRILTAAYVLLALRWMIYFQGLYSTRDNLIVTMLAQMP